MPLDLARLEHVQHGAGGKVTARCPACAKNGKDRGGQHLVVFDDGRFGCAANPGDSDHRKQIYRLCGVGGVFTPRAIPIRVKKSLRGAGGRYGR